MSVILYHVGEIFDDIDDQCWFTQTLISSVIDMHAPCKRRRAVKNPVPFMNSKLRKICHKKAMLSNRYYKNGRQKHDWEEFSKIRNLATKLKAKSMNAYFNENCNKIHKDDPKKFWNTMKPFVNDKSKGNDECQMLNINGTVCNDSDIIAEEFNSYFSNVVKNICKEKPLEYEYDDKWYEI